MDLTIEFLSDGGVGRTASFWKGPCIEGAIYAGFKAHVCREYYGKYKWLSVFGVGNPKHCEARDKHLALSRTVVCWDAGYMAKNKELGLTYCRASINDDHPSHALMDRTHPDPSRWDVLGLRLRNDWDPKGHVLVVGLGQKSRTYLNEFTWEERVLHNAAARFPDRSIVYRSKPRGIKRVQDDVEWEFKSEGTSIESALKNASLVICRHSNVAVDACMAGIPVECEGGAAHWLYSKHPNPTPEQRLDFLYRLAWWQWRLDERDMEAGWKFLQKVSS